MVLDLGSNNYSSATMDPTQQKNIDQYGLPYLASTAGYNMGVQGMGISEPLGTAWNALTTPSSVYAADSTSSGVDPYANARSNDAVTNPVNSNSVNTSANTNNNLSSAQQQWNQYHAGQGNMPVGYNGESTGGTNGDLTSQINDIYAPQEQYLNQAMTSLNSDYQNVLKNISEGNDVNTSTLEGQNQTGVNTLNQNLTTAGNQKDDALTAARRMYDELRRGYSQRFGGSTSAGQAASEISAVEQQRQQGLYQRSYNDSVNAINTQKASLEQSYSTQKLQLKYQTDSAMRQAQSDFSAKLLSIQNSQSQLASAKASASYDALQSLRNQTYAINAANLQFNQNLELQKSQAATSLDLYAKQLQLSGQGSQQALDLYNQQIANNQTPGNLTIGNTSTTTNPTLTGQMTGTKKVDRYGNTYYL